MLEEPGDLVVILGAFHDVAVGVGLGGPGRGVGGECLEALCARQLEGLAQNTVGGSCPGQKRGGENRQGKSKVENREDANNEMQNSDIANFKTSRVTTRVTRF